jgi:hypothetical protein
MGKSLFHISELLLLPGDLVSITFGANGGSQMLSLRAQKTEAGTGKELIVYQSSLSRGVMKCLDLVEGLPLRALAAVSHNEQGDCQLDPGSVLVGQLLALHGQNGQMAIPKEAVSSIMLFRDSRPRPVI